MEELNLALIDPHRLPATPTLRDWAATGFRRMRLMIVTFIAIFAMVVTATWLMPREYEAQTKILVKQERTDPVVSPAQNAPANPQNVTEIELNSEVELLKSRDLLKKVAIASSLPSQPNPSWLQSQIRAQIQKWTSSRKEPASEDARILGAIRNLEKNLTVEPLKKTKMIKVTYTSPDPKVAAAVLQNLVRLYLEKHTEVHRMPGALDFFQTQTELYQQGLADAERRLGQFAQQHGVAAATLEKEIAVNKLNEFESQVRQTRAAITETEQRIRALEQQEATTPPRQTTQVRTAANPLLQQELKKKLLDLELQRTSLLAKFTPEYRPVQEVEAQIKQAREELAKAESNPIREEITDRDATHEWLRGELAKARAELVGLQTRLTATAPIVENYRGQAQQLGQTELVQQDLVRSAKTAEEQYLLYARKEEEARISDELDKQRIVNVSVAEEATPPAFASSPNWMLNLFLGFLLACFASIGIALTADHFDRSFRTPAEVELILNVPVLAYLPKS